MMLVMTTTSTAAVQILSGKIDGLKTLAAKTVKVDADWTLIRSTVITSSLLVAMLACTVVILVAAGWKVARRR